MSSKQVDIRCERWGNFVISGKNEFSVRYYMAPMRSEYAGGITDKWAGVFLPNSWQNLAVNYTRTITRPLMNWLSFAYNRDLDRFSSLNTNLDPSMLVPGLPAGEPVLYGVPTSRSQILPECKTGREFAASTSL